MGVLDLEGGMSARWRARQAADEYVKRALREGYRSRAAYKLKQIDARVKPQLLKRGQTALELGAAPGSWSQVLVEKGMRVVAVDLLPFKEIPGVSFVRGDFTDSAVQEEVLSLLDGQLVDVLLSDMSPNRSGHASLGTSRQTARTPAQI